MAGTGFSSWTNDTNSTGEYQLDELYFFDSSSSTQDYDAWTRYRLQLLRYYLGCVATAAVCILGAIGNILSALVISRQKLSSTHVYLLALAVTDTLMLTTSLALFVPHLENSPARPDERKHLLLNLRTSYRPAYVYMFPIVHSFCLIFQAISVWMTLAFSMDRYLMICHPFIGSHISSTKTALKVVVVQYVLGVLYGIPRFLEYKVTHLSALSLPGLNVTLPSQVVPEITEFGKSATFRNLVHFGFYFLLQSGLPLAILAVLNTLLLREIRRSRNRAKSLRQAVQDSRTDTTVMLVGVVGLFLTCQAPALASRVIWALDFDFATRSVSGNVLNEISNFMVVLNSAANIVPYYFFSRAFRNGLLKLLTGRKTSTWPTTTNPAASQPVSPRPPRVDTGPGTPLDATPLVERIRPDARIEQA